MILNRKKYLKVKKAQSQGARTVNDIKDMTNIVIESDEESKEIDRILQVACKCQNVSVSDVVLAVKNGATTLDEVKEKTKACVGCGVCINVLKNIIENKK